MERKGVALFAWNRGAVLEDRYIDRLAEGHQDLASVVGVAKQVVTRLVRSCPEGLTEHRTKRAENEEIAACICCKHEE